MHPLRILALAVFPASCFVATSQAAAAVPAQGAGSSSTIKRPSWGKVVGWVVDASARKPIRQAAVSLEIEGAFPASGKSTGQTDAAGRFAARAPLGRISSN